MIKVRTLRGGDLLGLSRWGQIREGQESKSQRRWGSGSSVLWGWRKGPQVKGCRKPLGGTARKPILAETL